MATKLAKLLADFTSNLAVQVTAGGTTGSLISATDSDGIALPTGTYYLTIDGGNSVKEFWQCTITGVNITNIQNVSRQGVISAGSLRTHRAGATVIISDFAHIKFINNLLDGTDSFNSGVKLGYDGDPGLISGDTLKFATVGYANGLAIAGAPDSSTSQKGIGKVSVAPVSPTNPIFVGDNDPRVPTTNQINAMAGTSGTAPSGANKFVDNSDTAQTSSASKVVRAAASGLIDLSFIPGSNQQTYVAGEALTVGNPVSINPADGKVYQASAATAGNYRSTGFIGFATASVAGGANIVVQLTGVISGLSLGAQQTSVASQIDIQNTTNTSGSTQQVYSGQNKSLLFFTGPKTANITQINVNLGQSGTGAGQLTGTLLAVTSTGSTVVTGAGLGSQNIAVPGTGEQSFVFSSPIVVTPNTWYVFTLSAAAGNNTNSWNWNQSNVDATIPVGIALDNGLGMLNTPGCYWFKVFTTLQQNWQPGDIAWLSNTNGNINADLPGTVFQPIGIILSSSQIRIQKSSGELYTGSLTLGSPGTGRTSYGFPVPKNCTKIIMSANGGVNTRPTGGTQVVVRDGPVVMYINDNDGSTSWVVQYQWGKWSFGSLSGTPSNMIAYFYQ